MPPKAPPVEEDNGQQPTEDMPPVILEDADGNQWAGPVLDTETDSVDDLLRKDYSSDIIDDVKEFAGPNWDDSPSSLDGVEDLEEHWWYNFRLPPQDYDLVQEAAEEQIEELEQFKQPVNPQLIKEIEQRQQLVAGKPLEEVARIKHAAYYRAMQQLRAAKKEVQQEDQQQILADAGAPSNLLPADLTLPPAEHLQRSSQSAAAATASTSTSSSSSRGRQFRKKGAYELLAPRPSLPVVEDPEDWDTTWTDPTYTRHPQVLAQLASVFSSMPGVQQQQQEQEALADAASTSATTSSSNSRGRYKPSALTQYVEAALAEKPFQSYTPGYAAYLKHQQALQRRRRLQKGAFLLGLGGVAAVWVWKWWRGRGKAKGSQQQQRQGHAAARKRQPVGI